VARAGARKSTSTNRTMRSSAGALIAGASSAAKSKPSAATTNTANHDAALAVRLRRVPPPSSSWRSQGAKNRHEAQTIVASIATNARAGTGTKGHARGKLASWRRAPNGAAKPRQNPMERTACISGS
jgi:hypothetical protein